MNNPILDRLRLAGFYVGRSSSLDAATLRLLDVSWPERSRFLADKAKALAAVARHRPATVRVGDSPLGVRTFDDVGTIQSSLLDVYDLVVRPGILSATERPVVVDVGANIGQFSAALLAFVPGAQIVAVEPDPIVYERLRENLGHRLAGSVNAALGAEAGTLPLHRREFSVMSSLVAPTESSRDDPAPIEVPVRTLDDVTADLGPIDLVKIDVEGYEGPVLAGAAQTLARAAHLLVEISVERATPMSNLDALALVRQACPNARIVSVGRPLGAGGRTLCVDVLIALT